MMKHYYSFLRFSILAAVLIIVLPINYTLAGTFGSDTGFGELAEENRQRSEQMKDRQFQRDLLYEQRKEDNNRDEDDRDTDEYGNPID
jgi:hypothetical protein